MFRNFSLKACWIPNERVFKCKGWRRGSLEGCGVKYLSEGPRGKVDLSAEVRCDNVPTYWGSWTFQQHKDVPNGDRNVVEPLYEILAAEAGIIEEKT